MDEVGEADPAWTAARDDGPIGRGQVTAGHDAGVLVDAVLRDIVQRGGSQIGAVVGPAGNAVASRCWGMDLGEGADARVRLILPADMPVTAGAGVAVTVTDVETFASRQIKGTVVEVGPMTEPDHARMTSYIEDFFAAIERANGFPRALVERMVPHHTIAATIRVTENYDQTPGPRAGDRL